MAELSPPSVNLQKLYKGETLPEEPVLIVISPGADPSQELQELANDTIGHDRYHQVSSLCIVLQTPSISSPFCPFFLFLWYGMTNRRYGFFVLNRTLVVSL